MGDPTLPGGSGRPDDQARLLTPKEAIAAGATYLVVGRPILEAASPARAAELIVAEVAEALHQSTST